MSASLLACHVWLYIHSVNSLSAGTTTRRTLLQRLTTSAVGIATTTTTVSPRSSWGVDQEKDFDTIKHPFRYSDEWTGTLLPRLDLAQSVNMAMGDEIWPMGRWPDPVLRIPAEPVAEEWLGTETLKRACNLLTQTARQNGAVGLAAQQCGVNARIIVLEKEKKSHQGLFGQLQPQPQHKDDRNTVDDDFIVMINPKIIRRSPEIEARVWDEHCLVLPPNFVATVVRDATVDVQYRTAEDDKNDDAIHVMRLTGEKARAMQHELDHDRGILVTDHVGLSDLPDTIMRQIEQSGHDERMMIAFDRYVYEASYY